MPDHTTIYQKQAETYHQLISKQADLKETIEEIRSCSGIDIADLGAGTGRFAAALASEARSLLALDASEAMLRITADRLQQTGLTNWRTLTADHRKLPLEESSMDLIVSGWSICYLANAHVPDWEQNLHQIIGEIKRVLRPGGTVIIFETLGTGTLTPMAPDYLKPYYTKLVETYGFSHKWIRTDYRFDSLQQAEHLSRFFFGEELASEVIKQNWIQLPECAGIWWLHV